METVWLVVAAIVCLVMLGVALMGLACSMRSSQISRDEEEKHGGL